MIYLLIRDVARGGDGCLSERQTSVVGGNSCVEQAGQAIGLEQTLDRTGYSGIIPVLFDLKYILQ
jgi:hypothetical protein